MRTLLLASSALVALATGAQAQDAGYDWSGFYVGVQAGYGWSDVDVEGLDITESETEEGFAGGVHLGVDWQRGQFVYGLVSDLVFLDVEDSSFSGKFEGYNYDVDWLATARVRGGFAVDRALIYGTGGVAFAGIDVEGSAITGEDSSSGVEVGGVIGGGLEFAINDKWSMKGEYLHHFFDDIELDLSGPTATFDPSIDVVKFGVSYRF